MGCKIEKVGNRGFKIHGACWQQLMTTDPDKWFLQAVTVQPFAKGGVVAGINFVAKDKQQKLLT
eukprot:2068072-Lingulodinium_polyedra.AAC.1